MIVARVLLGFLAVISGSAAAGGNHQEASFDPDVSSWHESFMPKSEEALINWKYSVGMSDISWEVYLSEGEVRAKRYQPDQGKDPWRCPSLPLPKGFSKNASSYSDGSGWPGGYERRTSFYQVYDGWIVGFYNRFEGEVWWCSSEESSKSYKIVDANPEDIVVGDRTIYILDRTRVRGEHMDGFIKVVEKNSSDVWTSTEEVKLPSRPIVGLKYGQHLLILGDYSSLYTVDDDYEVQSNLSRDDWYIFRPNSMVIKNKNMLYIGAKQYVVEVDMETWRIRYLVPSEEFIQDKVKPKLTRK